MTLQSRKPVNQISAKRLEEFGGRMPYNSLEKPDGRKPSWKPKRWTDTGPDEATVALIWRRDGGRCACCGDVIPPNSRRGYEWCIAHRKLRAHGVDNRPSNLYLSCGNGSWGCEAETHRHPERSYDAGRMVESYREPGEVPMEHHFGTVLLDDEGGVTVIQAVRIEETNDFPF